MSRRRRADNPVSLFPFVAVMASTMGALILLLLVTARQASKARDAAWLEQQRSANPLPALPPLPGLAAFPELPPLAPHELPPLVERVLPALPPLTDPRSAILARKEQIERELAELRKKRERTPKAGEERLAPLMREAALLRNRLQQIVEDRRRAQAALEKSKLSAEELAAEKEKAAERRRTSPNKYAVTPYFGPNATNRRPIYLECTKDEIVLRPEGVAVATAALEDDARADNPLARVLHVVADYWTKRDQEPAYPLLIVRPDGVHSYYVARAALEFLRYPFGYELVAADRELAYPAVNERVKAMAEAAAKETGRSKPRMAMRGPRSGEDRGDGVGGDQTTPGGSQATLGRATPNQATPGRDTSDQATVESAQPERAGQPGNGERAEEAPVMPNAGRPTRNSTGVVTANIPPPQEEPDEPPAELGGTVRDYIARRQGPTGSRPGLGMLAAMAPTPFENPNDDRGAGGTNGGRGRRQRAQARVDAELQRPEPTLSQRVQEMAQEAPLPLPTGRSQTQQWQPGLEGMQQTPGSANTDASSAPSGVWSASPSGGNRQSPDSSNEWRPRRRAGEAGAMGGEGSTNMSAPDGSGMSPPLSTLGVELFNAANSCGAGGGGKRDPFDLGLGSVEYVERSIRCEVRAGTIVLEKGQTYSLRTDEEALAVGNAVAGACMKAVQQWPTAPHGSCWRPYVLLLVREGAAENAYRLRAALAAAGISAKQTWVDDHGVPTMWGR